MPLDLKARQRSYANRLGFVAEYGGQPAKPVNTVAPAITGTATVGQTLTATDGTWTGTPDPVLSRQWFADDVAIEGATATTLVLAPAQAGAVITVVVTGVSIAGSAAKASAPTSAVAGAVPVNSAPPTITGTAQVGETLTAGDGAWTGVPTPVLTREWFADGEVIEDATGSTYDLTENELGKAISVIVTATSIMGVVSETSAATVAVIAAE